ncbi:MAG: hypothetical protein ACPL7D_04870 [Candidatus Sumerlaeaceae bacterium]
MIKRISLMLAVASFLAGASIAGAWSIFGSKKSVTEPPPQEKIRIAVLDFSVAPRIVERRDEHRRLVRTEKPVETEKDVRGWWFGSNDVYYNANIGRIAADIFDEELRKLPELAVYSRQDLRLFYTEKRAKIEKKLKLDEKSAAASLDKLDPIAVGRELGVDKVLLGRICDAELRKNRTFGPFASVTSFNVTVYDVKSGRVDFSESYAGHDNFKSVYGNIEGRAKKFARKYQKSLHAK